jgi:hypothetical protein
MKKVFLIALALMFALSSISFASVQLYQDSEEKGHINKLNCSNGLTCTKVGDQVNIVTNSSGSVGAITSGTISGAAINSSTVGATTRATGAFTTLAANGATTLTNTLAVSGTTALNGAVAIASGAASLSGFRVTAISSAARPASGATAGTIITMTNTSSSTDCGVVGGTSFVVCISDGTNWKAL